MRLAIVNATRGGLSGGYEKYLRELVPLFASDSRVRELSIWYPEQLATRVIPGADHVGFWRGNPRLAAPPELLRAVTEKKYDVIFFPTQRIFRGLKRPVVCMVRNMEPLARCWQRPRLSGILSNLAKRFIAHQAVQLSQGVVAVSSFVRSFLHDRWHVADGKVEVIYHGISEPNACNLTEPPWAQTLKGPFVLAAGSIVPYRGFEDIILAALSPELTRSETSIILAGPDNGDSDGYGPRLRDLIHRSGLDQRVRLVGKMSSPEMNWAYDHCACYVATSRVEACPNTALEALAAGCTIVSNSCPPHPEFFADAADYYPAGNARELSNRLLNALGQTESQRVDRSRTARLRASYFTWARTADQTISFLLRHAGSATQSSPSRSVF